MVVFQRAVILVFAALVTLNYYPVFLGKVPLPTDQIIQFPVFQKYQNPVTLNNRHGEMGDAMTQWYPWRKQAGESMRRGTLPLWNPHLLAGTPFQADPMSALFYPLNWLFIVLPAPVAWSLSFMVKIFLAAVFTALFLGEIGVSPWGRVIGGMAFAFGGFMTTWIAWTHSDVSIWLPLVCFFTLRLCSRPSLRAAVFLAIPVAMTLVAGHPGVAAYVIVTAGCYGLWITLCNHDSHFGPSILFLAAATGLALAFAAVQVIPTIEWLGAIDRTLEVTWPPLRLSYALALFSRDLSADINSAGIPIPLATVYVGALTLLLAPLAFFHRNRRDAVFFAVAGMVSFCSAYGIGPVDLWYDKLPVFKGLKKEEALLLVDFSLAVLAGLGTSLAEGFQWREWVAGKRAAILAAVVLAAAACHQGTAWLSRRTMPGVDWWRSPRSFRVLLMVSAALILLRLFQLLPGRRWALLAAALLTVDMLSFSHAYFPFNPVELIFPPAGMFDFLKEQPKPFRVISLNGSNPVNIEPNYGLSAADGYDFMLKRLLAATSGLTAPRRDVVAFDVERVLAANNRVLDLLNVKYLVTTPYNDTVTRLRTRPGRFREVWSDSNVSVFENMSVLPRAFLVPQSRIVNAPTEEEEWTRVADPAFDPMNAVILPPEFKAGPGGDAGPAQAARFEEETNNRVRIAAAASMPSVLVLSQIYYPGWSAYIDGKKTPVIRTNYTFTGVLVDRGTHVIEFRFLPATFLWGAALSVASILLAILFAQKPLRRFGKKSRLCLGPAQTRYHEPHGHHPG